MMTAALWNALLAVSACVTEEDCPDLDVDTCAEHGVCRTIDGKPLVDDGAGGLCVDWEGTPSEPFGCMGADIGCPAAEGYGAPVDDPSACAWFSSLCLPAGWVACDPAVDAVPECGQETGT
jgi:hypothetical protein